MVCCQFTLCGEASSRRLPGIRPAGYDSQTGYQYDSISRVAGHRELAPPSKFSKLGGFNSNVFITSGIRHPQPSKTTSYLKLSSICRFGFSTPWAMPTACPQSPCYLDNSLPELVAYAQFFLRTPFLLRNSNYKHGMEFPERRRSVLRGGPP